MRKILLTAMLALMAMTISAVPAKRGLQRSITTPDGKVITATLVGDEHGHYWQGSDGQAYQAYGDDDREAFRMVDANTIRSMAAQRREAVNRERIRRLPMNRSTLTNRVGEVGNYRGQRRGLVILVNYKDVTFKPANNQAYYDRVANEVNFHDGNFVGSMYDYFYAQSGGLFELNFDVVGPVPVSQNRSYYGGNNSNGDDKHPAAMVCEAVKKADEYVNYKDYDWDNDGYVDQVYVVYAGKGEADSGIASTVWPHAWNLSSAAYYGDGEGALHLDGVIIDQYACGEELDGSTGTIAGPGTMCHEFSHCLGYPDFYDTDYSGGQGMADWDLMDSGSYNGGGYRPAGYTSYERWMAGWVTPIELTTSTSVTGMKGLQDGGESYIIYNQGNRNEFYMLENRTLSGWDAALPGKGLLIVHADYDAGVWAANGPNDDPSHQRMTWVPADGQYQKWGSSLSTSGMATDTYPYGLKNAFGKNTTPAATLYNQNDDGSYYLNVSVEDITLASDGTISFNFIGENKVEVPTISPEGGVFYEPQTVTISAEDDEAVIYYTTDGSEPDAAGPSAISNTLLYEEPFTIDQTATVKAIAVVGEVVSKVAKANFVIRDPSVNTNTFQLLRSVDEIVNGKQYIIGYAAKSAAAGGINGVYLNKVDVELEDDIATINGDVAVFTLIRMEGGGYALYNEMDMTYLVATDVKNLEYVQEPTAWNFANIPDGVGLVCGNHGSMRYNVSSPRFNTYNSKVSTGLPYATIFMQCVKSEVTGISVVKDESRMVQKGVYDLQGRRISDTSSLPHGIYIIDGKKTVK